MLKVILNVFISFMSLSQNITLIWHRNSISFSVGSVKLGVGTELGSISTGCINTEDYVSDEPLPRYGV